MDSPSAPGPCRFPGRCRRRDLGGRCLGAAPFWRTGAHRSWLWQLPSPRAWARPLSAHPRATVTAGSSDRDRRTLHPRPQSARSGVVGQFEIMELCRSSPHGWSRGARWERAHRTQRTARRVDDFVVAIGISLQPLLGVSCHGVGSMPSLDETLLSTASSEMPWKSARGAHAVRSAHGARDGQRRTPWTLVSTAS
jgi:hypothetical protein